MKYILSASREPIPCADVMTWARWFESADDLRIVRQDTLPSGVFVSTVFIGLDHGFGDGKRRLFETMVFRDGNGDKCERCATWAEAEAQHARIVARECQRDGEQEHT